MAIELSKEVKELLDDRNTIKIVASVGKSGVVNSAVKQSVRLNENGQIEFLEFLETSDTNRNVIHSLWFEHNISILLLGNNNESYELRGIPTEAIIEGRYFEKKYVEVHERFEGKLDLATVWIVDITEVRNKDIFARQLQEREDYPIVSHLDRLAK